MTTYILSNMETEKTESILTNSKHGKKGAHPVSLQILLSETQSTQEMSFESSQILGSVQIQMT